MKVGEDTVKGYLLERRYGFIGRDYYEEGVFIHRAGIRNSSRLAEEQKVQFDVEETPRGPIEVNLEVIHKRKVSL